MLRPNLLHSTKTLLSVPHTRISSHLPIQPFNGNNIEISHW